MKKKLFTVDGTNSVFLSPLLHFSLLSSYVFGLSQSHVWWKEFFIFTDIQVVNNVHCFGCGCSLNQASVVGHCQYINCEWTFYSPVLSVGVLSVLPEDLCMCRFSLLVRESLLFTFVSYEPCYKYHDVLFPKFVKLCTVLIFLSC